MTATLVSLQISDSPEAWRSAGFEVDDKGGCHVGSVRLDLGSANGTPSGWGLAGVEATEVDGIPTHSDDAATRATEHPNGVTGIDHVVVWSQDLERTLRAFAEIGVEPRRQRDGDLNGLPIRQVFFRLGASIIEVVGLPDAAEAGPARIWGVTFEVGDIDALAAHFGEGVGRVKDAVQPGRRITTLRHKTFGISLHVAFITPVP